MHSITYPYGAQFGEIVFEAGVTYLVEDHNAAQFMIQGDAQVHYLEAPGDLPAVTTNLNGHRLLIARCGALGDLLMLTPTLREIKSRWPTCHVTLACFPRYRAVLDGNPHVDALIDYPVRQDLYTTFTDVVWLENAVETHPDSRTLPIIDSLAKRFGFDALPDKTTDWYWLPGELAKAERSYPKGKKKRLGVQCRASGAYKSLPADLLDSVMSEMLRRDWEIFLFGHPGEIRSASRAGVTNLTQDRLTLRQSAAVAATCDVLLSPDSFMVHLAGALGKPCVACYGPFPSALYTRYYPKCYPVSGHGRCAPCFHHPRGTHFPTSGPCWQSGKCDVLSDIKPDRIISKIESAYANR